MRSKPKVAVVIPSYAVRDHILDVITSIGTSVDKIYVVDDLCPENTGDYVEEKCTDERVVVIRHQENQGVGGAVLTGYKAAINDNMDIIVKVDGDGQMDTSLIPDLISPILRGDADYTKGNRFYDLEKIHEMPPIRVFGNAALSFVTKISSGYWNIFDPTNGFTAIHSGVAQHLPLNKISRRYFFETDMLFRLNTLRAVVIDVPMDARYGLETSHLKIRKIIGEFIYKHLRNTVKRIFYNYYLRDLSIASLELPSGVVLMMFGTVFGVFNWIHSIKTGVSSTSGTVMLAALPIIIGLQLILSFLHYDISTVPIRPFHQLSGIRKKRLAK